MSGYPPTPGRIALDERDVTKKEQAAVETGLFLPTDVE